MMYLLDTSVFVHIVEQRWSVLSQNQMKIINDSTNEFVLSQASVYELSIKERLGKLQLKLSLDTCLDVSRKQLGIKYLPISESDYRHIVNIPKVYKKDGKHHGDPFDLLIIAQAIRKNLSVLTTDEYFPYYQDLHVIE